MRRSKGEWSPTVLVVGEQLGEVLQRVAVFRSAINS